jgi:hypothetical protein
MILVANGTIGVCYLIEIIAAGLFLDVGSFCNDIWRAADLVYIFAYLINYYLDEPILHLMQYLRISLIEY